VIQALKEIAMSLDELQKSLTSLPDPGRARLSKDEVVQALASVFTLTRCANELAGFADVAANPYLYNEGLAALNCVEPGLVRAMADLGQAVEALSPEAALALRWTSSR
jgi:hypothetical protein